MQKNPSFSNVYFPPKSKPVIGVVQFIHDMSEHQGRYEELSDFWAENGIIVITSDLRGHGCNVKRESEIGYWGDYGLNNPIGFIHEISMYIKSQYPDLPYILVGHGLGALISMSYFKRYDYFLDALVLSSPMTYKNTTLSRLVCNAYVAAKGEYFKSKSVDKMITGGHVRSNVNSWLSTDDTVISNYLNDRSCGFTYTLNGYSTILSIIDDAYKKGSWIRKNLHVPIDIIAGNSDICPEHTLKAIKKMYLKEEYDNIQITQFKNLRHDIFNGEGSEVTRKYILKLFKNLKSH